MTGLTVLELCAGAGGQSLGLERAGFEHVAAIDNDPDACTTLKRNRPSWDVIERSVTEIDGRDYRGVDLVAGGVPCPPFSVAGKQLGAEDERDLFPEALRIISEAKPQAVLIENVRGLLTDRFKEYRAGVINQLKKLGYEVEWKLLNASNYGVPQLRPRSILVGLKPSAMLDYRWPEYSSTLPTVGNSLADLMSARDWAGADAWVRKAQGIAPTVVGGSKKHGGPDLGPTRARAQWKTLGVDGLGIADEVPGPDFPKDGLPRLTARMVARIQGFPDEWLFSGTKTAAYRQIGNAFPPPVAEVVGSAISKAIRGYSDQGGQGRLLETAGAYSKSNGSV